MLKPLSAAVVLCAAVAAVALPAAAQTPASNPSDTFYLDLYEKPNDGFAGPASSKKVLTKGVPYVARVRGTGSFYRVRRDLPTCGAPQRKALYRSPKAEVSGSVIADPEFILGALKYKKLCPKTGVFATRVWLGFRVSTGGKTYYELTPIGGAYTAPTTDHTYVYGLVGTGAKAKFRVTDRNARDNYGRFKIQIRRATAADCLNGNAVRMGYATEADCVAVALPGAATAFPVPVVPVTPPA